MPGIWLVESLRLRFTWEVALPVATVTDSKVQSQILKGSGFQALRLCHKDKLSQESQDINEWTMVIHQFRFIKTSFVAQYVIYLGEHSVRVYLKRKRYSSVYLLWLYFSMKIYFKSSVSLMTLFSLLSFGLNVPKWF